MSILNSLLGLDDTSLGEKDLAFDMLKDSKFGVTSLSTAAVETVNPELRSLLRCQLDNAVKEHFQLSDILIKKGWYPAFDTPQDQLKKEEQMSQNMNSEQ
ncbi:MAG: spore coat protein [Bacillota bacterium]|nr:spore coat protein [Bacillota bacterium]